MTAALRIAVLGVGPSPVGTILPPDALERIAEEARRMRWRLPEEEGWPGSEKGEPVVETRRLDVQHHRVVGGQTLSRLRQMYRVSTAELQEWNPGIDLHSLSHGQELIVWQRKPEAVSRSVGAANRGRLIAGEPLPAGENYRILYPHRTYGTYYTVSEIVRVMDAYAERFPESDPLMIGDISFRNGRSIHPHRSHQAGRDVDITYPRHNPPPNYNRFHHVRRDELDVEEALWLITEFIRGGQVEYIFADRYHQRRLRAEAKRQGATEEWLDAVFQYPHHTGGQAVVRHARGHRGHFHVRFKCQETDRRCH
ncbi:MAG: penicillin-insensitive murein endopeptidase [Bradymonadaceae bacterium]